MDINSLKFHTRSPIPELFDFYLNWALSLNETPYIFCHTEGPHQELLSKFEIYPGVVVLNISAQATRDFHRSDTDVSFKAYFLGEHHHITIPLQNVIGFHILDQIFHLVMPTSPSLDTVVTYGIQHGHFTETVSDKKLPDVSNEIEEKIRSLDQYNQSRVSAKVIQFPTRKRDNETVSQSEVGPDLFYHPIESILDTLTKRDQE